MTRYGQAALTEEQIAEIAEKRSTTNRGYKRVALKIMREESGSKWVDKALRRVHRLEKANGAIEGLEFVYVLSAEITRLVNSQY